MSYDFSIAGRVREQGSDGGSIAHAEAGGAVLPDAVGQLEAEFATFEAVEARLVEAWGYLLRMPDREGAWQRLRANWPDVRRHNHFGDYGDMDPDARPRPPGLRTAEVDRMEEALGWVEWVGERDRRLIGVVLGQLQRVDRPEWEAVARRIDASVRPDAYRMRYGRALYRICRRLNAAEIRR